MGPTATARRPGSVTGDICEYTDSSGIACGRIAMGRLLVLLAAVLSLAFAPAPFPRRERPAAVKEELNRLHGIWELVCESHGGRPQFLRQLRWAFIGDNLVQADDHGLTRWRVKLELGRRLKGIDLESRSEKSSPDHFPAAGYVLEDDTLWVCYDLTLAGRPKHLLGSEPSLVLLE